MICQFLGETSDKYHVVDSQLISFLHGLGIKFPEKNLNPRGFLLQLLKDQDLKDDIYYPWAKEKYQIPFLKDQFFSQFEPQIQIWEAEKDSYEWDEGFIPLYRWEDKLIVACVDIPEEFIERSDYVLVLCSILELEKVWRYYHSPLEFSFVSEFGIQPLEKSSTNLAPAALETKQSVQQENSPMELLELSELSELSEDSSSEESPEDLSLESRDSSEHLSLDISMAPPVLKFEPLSGDQPVLGTLQPPPPPPPPQAMPLNSPSQLAQVIPMKSEIPNSFRDVSSEDIEACAEQMFFDYKEQNKRSFFGFVDQSKKKIHFTLKGSGPMENTEAATITVDQPSILNIVMRTQKPFYGKPFTSELNKKLYEIINEQEEPEVIMVIPFVYEDQVLAVIGFIADQESYSLDRLAEYESRFQKDIRLKMGLTSHEVEKAS